MGERVRKDWGGKLALFIIFLMREGVYEDWLDPGGKNLKGRGVSKMSRNVIGSPTEFISNAFSWPIRVGESWLELDRKWRAELRSSDE